MYGEDEPKVITDEGSSSERSSSGKDGIDCKSVGSMLSDGGEPQTVQTNLQSRRSDASVTNKNNNKSNVGPVPPPLDFISPGLSSH